MLGQVVGNYLITEVIGEGGMGSVYLGKHRLIGRSAAIKLLREDLSHNKEIVGRFFNEAKASTAVRHPGIVEVFDFGTHGDRAYLVMERLEGETLRERIMREGQIAESRALQIARQVLGALGAAHASGIVHRDLKPDNIFLVHDPDVTGGERTKILDFGIAKLSDDSSGAFRTQTGQIMGTPTYMSPEQCKGLPEIDARSDLYSIGCILYHLLCGLPPFVGRGAGEVLGAHMHVAPEPLRVRNPSVSPGVEAVVMRLLSKEPEQRYRLASHVVDALDGNNARDQGVEPTMPPSWMDRDGRRPATAKPAVEPEYRTTLSSASSVAVAQRTAAPGRPKWMIWGGAGAVVAVIAGVVIALSMGGGNAGGDQVAGGSGERAAGGEQGAAGTEQGTENAEQRTENGEQGTQNGEPGGEAESLGPAKVSIAIFSEPAGAEVYRKGDYVRVGVTPFEGEFTARDGGEHVFLLKLAGYEDREVVLSAETGGQTSVELEQKASGSKHSKHSKRTRSKTAAKTDKPVKKTKPKPKKELDDDDINPFHR